MLLLTTMIFRDHISDYLVYTLTGVHSGVSWAEKVGGEGSRSCNFPTESSKLPRTEKIIGAHCALNINAVFKFPQNGILTTNWVFLKHIFGHKKQVFRQAVVRGKV